MVKKFFLATAALTFFTATPLLSKVEASTAEKAQPKSSFKIGAHRPPISNPSSISSEKRASSHANSSAAQAMKGNKDFVVVLAVDGGGIRGIVPARMIEEIERTFNKPVTDIFDGFGGTSAGSIAVSILNTINPETGRPFSGSDLVKFVQEIGSKIFARPLLRVARTAGGLAGSKYSAKPLEDFLKRKLGETKISETVKPLTIVAYDFTNKKTFLFLSRSKQQHNADYNLWEVVRSSTAAPVLFKGHEMVIGGHRRTMIDGGIGGGMSPDLYLYDEVKKLHPGKKIFLVSLATGQDKNKSKIRGKGLFAGSIPGVLEQTIIQGLEAPIDQGKMILSKDPNVEYHRIDVQLPPDCAYPVDNPSPKNLQCLQKVAADFSNKQPFKTMVARLKDVLGGGELKTALGQAHQEDEFSNPNLPGGAAPVDSANKKKWYQKFSRKKNADKIDIKG